MTPAEEDALRASIELYPAFSEGECAGLYSRQTVDDCIRLAIRAAYAQGVAQERERLDEEISDAIQSDLENGVKWLNELAADDFKRKYPAINAILSPSPPPSGGDEG